MNTTRMVFYKSDIDDLREIVKRVRAGKKAAFKCRRDAFLGFMKILRAYRLPTPLDKTDIVFYNPVKFANRLAELLMCGQRTRMPFRWQAD